MKSKKAAMEMSVGTIVTIVLLMSVLVLGIFLVQKVFSSSTGAIDSIDNQVQSEISKLFADEDLPLVVYPTSGEIKLKKGDSPKGFAFSVKNQDVNASSFKYLVKAQSGYEFKVRCGDAFTESKANSYILLKEGTFELGRGNAMTTPEIVKFSLPDDAPPCTIPYRLEIYKGVEQTPYGGLTVWVTIK